MQKLILLCIVGIAGATIQSNLILPTQDTFKDDTSYKFNYGVNDPSTGDVKSHHEVKLGKKVTGIYAVREPDGTTLIVRYTASPDKGFNAIVQKIGNIAPSSGTTTKKFYAFTGNGLGAYATKSIQDEENDGSHYDFDRLNYKF